MKKTFILSLFLFSGLVAQTYCSGDQISSTHQNQEHLVGAGYDGYNQGDTFKLADWNGALNGGQYHVIFIDMSNSW
tara:strand:+ start:70 stop:297 length:228 start_codon:yes stop_codon:yes gene_type:complete